VSFLLAKRGQLLLNLERRAVIPLMEHCRAHHLDQLEFLA